MEEQQPVRMMVGLSGPECAALQRLARREDRTPRRQAERLLRQALIAAGVLEADERDRGVEDPGEG
jgi:hypothetical protein